MKERRGVFGAGLAGAIALVALLSITAAGTAGTATTAAPAAKAAPLVTAQNIRPPAVANARSIRARFGGTSLTFLGDGPVGKSHTRDVNLVRKFSRDTGIRRNRKKVLVVRAEVIAVSLLADVVDE